MDASDGEAVVDGEAMMARAMKLQNEDRKAKTWKGGRSRRRRGARRARRTRKNNK